MRGATIDHSSDTAAADRPTLRGVAYTGGAVVCAFRRLPRALPRVTIVALACRYVAVGVFVVGVG